MGNNTPPEDPRARVLMALIGRLVKYRFVGGNDIPSVLELGRKYVRRGFSVSYDLLLENVKEYHDVKRARRTLCDLVFAMDSVNYGNIAVKPSMFGLFVEGIDPLSQERQFEWNLRLLLKHVAERYPDGVEVEVDAEAHKELKRQLRVVYDIRSTSRHYTRIRQAVQMHLPDLHDLFAEYRLLDFPMRIVKGAGVYGEDDGLAVSDEKIKMRFLYTALDALRGKRRPYLATMRDRKFILELVALLEKHGFRKEQFEIQMLHGIGWSLAKELRAKGYHVRIYIPFVMPWCKDAWRPYVERRINMFFALFVKWFKEWWK